MARLPRLNLPNIPKHIEHEHWVYGVVLHTLNLVSTRWLTLDLKLTGNLPFLFITPRKA